MMQGKEFIARNLDLMGFYPGNQIKQAVQELVENSIDACTCSEISPTAKIIVSIDGAVDVSLIKVTVIDSGIGIENVHAAMQSFHSTFSTQDIEHARIGKYGLGLTSMLLFCLLKTGQHPVIKTKSVASNQDLANVYHILPNLEILQVEDETWFHIGTTGTKVEVTLPRTSTTASEVNDCFHYLAKLVLASEKQLQLEIFQTVSEEKRDYLSISSPFFNRTIDMEGIDSSRERRQLQEWINHAFPSLRCHDVEKITYKDPTFSLEILGFGLENRQVPGPAGNVPNGDEIKVAVQVWRFVNGRPLPKNRTCNIHKAICSIQTMHHNIKLSQAPDDEQEADFFLRNKREAVGGVLVNAAETARRTIVLFAIKVKINDISYGDFRKSGIVGMDEGKLGTIKQCCRACLLKVLQASICSQIFPSPAEYKHSYARDIAVPSITHSLTTIIESSQDEDFIRWCLEALDCVADSAAVEGNISDLVEDALLRQPLQGENEEED